MVVQHMLSIAKDVEEQPVNLIVVKEHLSVRYIVVDPCKSIRWNLCVCI